MFVYIKLVFIFFITIIYLILFDFFIYGMFLSNSFFIIIIMCLHFGSFTSRLPIKQKKTLN